MKKTITYKGYKYKIQKVKDFFQSQNIDLICRQTESY